MLRPYRNKWTYHHVRDATQGIVEENTNDVSALFRDALINNYSRDEHNILEWFNQFDGMHVHKRIADARFDIEGNGWNMLLTFQTVYKKPLNTIEFPPLVNDGDKIPIRVLLNLLQSNYQEYNHYAYC